MDAQQHIINSADPLDWDFIFLQEPYLDTLSKTRANHRWVVLYPPTHSVEGSARTRSVILANKSISSDTYSPLPIQSADITGIKVSTHVGDITLFNVYNSCEDNKSIEALRDYLRSPGPRRSRRASTHMFWMGDFNRHHPLWEGDQNPHLTSSEDMINPLLDLVNEHGMLQALPPEIPTLEALNSGTWTRPDNVWCRDVSTNLILRCDVAPERRPPRTDHLPIVTEIDTSLTRLASTPRKCFKNANWTTFKEKLEEFAQDTSFVTRPTSTTDIDTLLDQITVTVTRAVDESVPNIRPSPYMKRWWTKELTAARKAKEKASREKYRWRGDPAHDSHRAYKILVDRYTSLMRKAKEDKWYEFLSSNNAHDIWAASKYISGPPSDGGQARIPLLLTGQEQMNTAETNEEKAKALAKTFFIPKPASTHSPPPIPDREYSPLTPYSHQRIVNKARSLKRNKAPGPDGLPNEVWTAGIDILGKHITVLFNAIMTTGYYPKAWRQSTTVVLRKPGKPAYDVPKAYRPIALLNTLGKLLSGLIADDLSYICEANNLLSPKAFGGRPGRITTDAIHLLTHRIQDAWRAGHVVSVLFLDIQSAFPNLVRERLIYDMHAMGLPATYTAIVSSILSDRTTQLRFDDYTSSPIAIENGSDQGNPLSVILYNIYHSGLTRTPNHKHEDAAGYIDDAALLAEGPDFASTNARLKDMMERQEGALDWSRSHNSPFETSKLAVMHFSPSPAKSRRIEPLRISDPGPDGTTTEFEVERVPNYKYLGVLINEKLSWKPHFGVVQSRAISWTNLFCRLMKISKGLSYVGAKRIYNAVAAARINYACDVWYTPIHQQEDGCRARGSVGLTKKLTSIQRKAAIAISGALKSTAADAAEIHADLPPVQLRLGRLCALAALRAATLPQTHPLYSIASRKAKQRPVRRHRTTFQTLFHLNKIAPPKVEEIKQYRRPPSFEPLHATRIDPDKKAALTHDKENENTGVRIYTDGSGYGGHIGASAVLYENGVRKRTLQYTLGPDTEHTVYDGEAIGVLMGVKLASTSRLARTDNTPVTISLDNTAVIISLNNQDSRPSHAILDWIHDAIEELDEALADKLQVTWVPGHAGSRGNEAADEAAKQAAQGTSSRRSDLPAQIKGRKGLLAGTSAIRQKLTREARKAWTAEWTKSPRYRGFRRFEKGERGGRYEHLISRLRRNQMSIVTQLRTNHIPLNFYLHRIKKAESTDCPHCPGITEDVQHYLFACKNYAQARESLKARAGRNAFSIRHLFSTRDGVKHLLEYVHDTRRFERTLGGLWSPEDQDVGEE